MVEITRGRKVDYAFAFVFSMLGKKITQVHVYLQNIFRLIGKFFSLFELLLDYFENHHVTTMELII